MSLTAVLLCSAALVTETLTQSVDARLGAQTAPDLRRFADYPAGAAKDVFTANTNFWARDIDFSCASPWNSTYGRLRAGTLVSPRHIVFAKHFPLAAGARILFVGDDGQLCPCRIKATAEVPRSDIMVGALDYEVIPSVHPAKILPADYARAIGDGEGLPVVTLSQLEQAYVTELRAIPTNAAVRTMGSRVPQDPLRARFRREVVVGDSGNPAFLIDGREPILLYCLTTGGPGAGSALHRYRLEIQAVMNQLAPGYRLESPRW